MKETIGKHIISWSGLFLFLLTVSMLTAGICIYTVGTIEKQSVVNCLQEKMIMTGYEKEAESIPA